MEKAIYKKGIIQGAMVTLFCAIVTLVLWLCGASNHVLVIGLNMTTMSFAAACGNPEKSIFDILNSAWIVILSIIGGGFIGYYAPSLAPWLIIVYAVLVFRVPKTKYYALAFGLGALMFLVFSSLSFSWSAGWVYLPVGLFVICVLGFFFWLFKGFNVSIPIDYAEIPLNERKQSALIVGIALILGWILKALLQHYTELSHLYWIQLTILVVVQASQARFIRTSLLRILANIIGALIIIALMNYVIPKIAWINLLVLFFFVFMMFAASFSYVLRVIFIEMFVLTFIHMLEQYTNIIAYERISFTLMGGCLVMISAGIAYVLMRKTSQSNR